VYVKNFSTIEKVQKLLASIKIWQDYYEKSIAVFMWITVSLLEKRYTLHQRM